MDRNKPTCKNKDPLHHIKRTTSEEYGTSRWSKNIGSFIKSGIITDTKGKKLIRAVTTNNCEMVEELLQSKQVSPDLLDQLMRTPLHLAASKNYKDIIKILLKHGADPNQKDILGNTPLHLAACSNNLEIVTLLLDAGTDVSSLDVYGRNPLQLAESKLRLLQSQHREGCIESSQLCSQLQQVNYLIIFK